MQSTCVYEQSIATISTRLQIGTLVKYTFLFSAPMPMSSTEAQLIRTEFESTSQQVLFPSHHAFIMAMCGNVLGLTSNNNLID